MSDLPDLMSSMLFSSITLLALSSCGHCGHCACGHWCAGPHASTKTALSDWNPDLALVDPEQTKQILNSRMPPSHGPSEDWATHSFSSKHGLQIWYSPLFNFWQPNAHNLISARTDNPERVGNEFCMCYSCLLENKEIAATLALFQLFRSICDFRDMRGCTKCCWGSSDPFSKGQELPSLQFLPEHGWSSMHS